MKQHRFHTLVCLVLVVLLAAAALTLTGCQKSGNTATTAAAPQTEAPQTQAPAETEAPVTETPTETAAATAAPTETTAATETAAVTEAPVETAAVTQAPTEAPATETAAVTETPVETAAATESGAPVPIEVGEGTRTFYFEVTHANGEYKLYEVHTDADTVGDALTGVELIDGDDGQYGLYVTYVDGEYLDWNTDGMYWAFYENGEYASTGVDSTAIDETVTYSFTATAG